MQCPLAITKGPSDRLDIESACKEVVCENFGLAPEFSQHVCMTPGCAEGFIMVDGNEKVHRKICAAPTEHMRLAKDMPKTISACPNTPLLGGHHTEKSKYCVEHQYLEQPAASQSHPSTLVSISLPDERVGIRITKSLDDVSVPTDESVYLGCKKCKNVPVYHKRTAGVMFAVRPCGIIIDHRELYTCESSSQLFCQLLLLTDHIDFKFDWL